MPLRAKRWLLALFVVALCAMAVAQPVTQFKPSDYVNDFAHVLNAQTSAQISAVATRLDDKANAQVALVTINTLDGRDIESYSVDLFKQWGIGRKGTDRGVLILYVIQDHKARIEVGYGLEPILPDGKVGGFQREAIPLMRAGDYNAALSLVFSRVAQTIADDAKVTIDGALDQPAPRPQRERNDQVHLSFGQIIFFIILFIIVMTVAPLRTLFFWILLSGMGGGGRGGGGGFGGGGGGFGGFGGGSSGGGGASSSW